MFRRYYKFLLGLNRGLSWVLLILSGILLMSGYIQTRLTIDRSFWMPFHSHLGIIFTVLLISHTLISVALLRFPWRSSFRSILNNKAGQWTWIRFIQRASAWFLLVMSLLMGLSGLGWYSFNFWRTIPFHPHVRYETLFTVGLVVHAITGLKVAVTRNKITIPSQNIFFLIITVLAFVGVFYVDIYVGVKGSNIEDQVELPDTITEQEGTKPVKLGRVSVGSESFEFDPTEVETTRPDIFQSGYFSMFDVLVHLSEKGRVDLEYHFDETMNTYIIDKLEGEPYWWYHAYYDGGWRETNYFRPDHYPWKDGTTLHYFVVPSSRLEKTYAIYREEHQRLIENNGKIVIPRVIINGKTFHIEFSYVKVTAHNLRNDTFQDDVITAIDVILSLGDQGKLNYGLQWYEGIGTARTVKNYWVESINEDVARGRCGFVYESGTSDLRGFTGNHIHLPSDIRALNSPEYVMYFWICI